MSRPNITPAQGILTPASPLRQVWPDGLVPLRLYRGVKVFDPSTGKIVENGVVHALDLSAEHPAIREQLALAMSRHWRWDFRQALLLLEVDGELPIGDEHLSGTIFRGNELQTAQAKG